MHIQTSEQEKLVMGFGDYTCNWGLHIAGLYETGEERDEILMGFLHQGNIDRDLQFYCPVERSQEDFIQHYAYHYPDCAAHLNDHNIFQLYTARQLYYPNGTFSPLAMDEGLTNFFVESQKLGRRNVRATTEMVWALAAIPGVEHLMVYESRLNYFVHGKPWISICLYNVTKFSGDVIMQVLRTHPFTISGGVITENPYYLEPDIWLSRYAPEFLDRA